MGNYTAQIGGIGPFDILSFSWAPQYASAGSTSGNTRAQVSDVVVTKPTDANSAVLAQAAAAGSPFSSATITMNDSSGPKVFNFSNVVIASFSAGSQSGDSAPMEQMDWNFSQMTANLSPYDDGSSGGVCTMDGSLDQSGSDDGTNSSSL
jgi:type VI protein secretion system component Hcp